MNPAPSKYSKYFNTRMQAEIKIEPERRYGVNRIISAAITLMELVVAMVLLSIIVLGISQIDIFSHLHVISADRRVKIDNEASLALEHMIKEIGKAIGNEISNGADTVVEEDETISGDSALQIYIDANGNGQKDDAAGTDRWIAYRFTGASGQQADRYQLWYCPNCDHNPCNNCTPGWGTDANNTIAKKIKVFNPIKRENADGKLNRDFVTIQLTTCWDPANVNLTTHPNGTREEPCVNMNARIKMPSVSTN